MSGRKFVSILKVLSVADNTNTEDPTGKFSLFVDLLHFRFNKYFESGKELSIDDTLLRAYGQIKFKVRIVTNSARYGIKLYVLADSKTRYIFNLIMYSGK